MRPPRPYWRKTKQEVVDEKVERLFDSYKRMEEQMQMLPPGEQDQSKVRKYFPEEDSD